MPSYIDQVSSLGPRIWYRFNETAGSPVNSGSLSNTLTAVGTPLQNEQTEVDGRCIYLNGTSRYDLSPLPAFSLFDDRSFSIEMWVKASATDVSSQYQPQLFTVNHATATNRYITLEFVGSAFGGSTGKISWEVVNGSGTGNSVLTTQTYNDNNWHHIVATLNTTSMKLYVDGTLKASKNVSYGTFDFDTSPLGKKFIGNSYRGRIDEFAVYDYELTPQNILDNFNAGASVDFAPGVLGTASALAVQPTQTTTAQLTAAPMTASADGSGHAASTIDLPKLLNTYMGELTLETWFKFDINRYLQNYGSGTTAGANWTGTPKNDVAGGIQGTGSIALNNTDLVLQIGTQMSSLLQDEDFAIGFWVKKLTKEATTAFFTSLLSTGTDLVEFSWNADGGIRFRINAGNQNHDISSSTDITDGEWHFVVGKFSSNTQQLWIDNTSIGTNTINQGLTLDITRFQGGGSTDDISLSQFFIATSANIGTTQIANIYDYGIPTSTQASAYMPPAAPKFNSAFNDYIQSKSPLFDFRMDEGSGVPKNFGSAEITLSSELSPQGYIQNESGLNTRTFKFTDRAQGLRGNYNLSSGTLSSNNTATIGVLFKTNWKTLGHTHIGLGGTVSGSNGIYLNTINTGVLRVFSGNANGTTTNLTGTTDFTDNKWHLAIVVQEANTLKLYVDGKLEASTTRSTAFTDAGQFSIALPPGLSQTANNTLVKYIDEAFATNTAFTAQEVFEAWQALRLEMDTTATAEFVMPTNIAGTGTTQTAAVTTASALFPISTNITEQILDAAPGTASALFVLPNFGGNVVIDANYGHTAATASVVFHDPQFQIGDFHSADHMDASALMVHPTSISGGQISVSTHIGGPATFVMPGIVTIKGAQVFAEPALAGCFLPLPPSYLTLNDDDWYVRLLEGHADRLREAVQTAGTGTNLPNQPSTDVIQGGFLSFFDDVLLDITPNTTIKTISSEIPAYYFKAQESVSYDTNGNILPPDTTKNSAVISVVRGSNTPQPRVGSGYFDNQQRKAVRIENAEFTLPGTTSQNSERPYNLEFSIKTLKQNQVLSYGVKTSAYTYGRKVGAIGLYDGKIYLTEDAGIQFSLSGPGIRGLYPTTAPHPKNFINRAQYLLSRTNIADGKWHHIVIQKGWNDARTQIWIDGKLDIQFGVQTSDGGSPSYTNIPGLDGTNNVRPYILGFNSSDPLLYSDFETSAWNFYPGRFLTTQQIGLNYLAYQKAKPIKVAPMLGTVTIGKDTIGRGNRARMLLLYWWQNQTGYNQFVTTTRNSLTTGYDGNNSPFGPEDLIDYPGRGPNTYFDWDVFPISVTGKSGMSDIFTETSVRTNAGYVDTETGSYRMLDLQKDLDLSQFDMIMFANYPTTSAQLDEYIRDEYVDSYFGTTEKDIYADFLKSLRKAVDSGISLFVQFDQLARDLKIYDRVDRIPIFNESDPDIFSGSDPRGIELTSNQWDLANNKVIVTPAYPVNDSGAEFDDRANNSRHRVINTIEYLTDDPSFIWTDNAYYQHSDVLDFGAPDRVFNRYEYRINGLQTGDEFIFGNPSSFTAFGNSRTKQTSILAIPFDNVKAGKIITAQPEKYYKGANLVDNPYKNYAHSIALSPGDVLDGKAIGGKIFVSISEVFWDSTTEERFVDLYSDYWIDMIYNLGFWGLKLSEGGNGSAEAKRDSYKAKPEYISPNGKTTEYYNHLTYWSQNADFARMQFSGGDPTGIALGLFFGIGDDNTKQYVSKNRQSLGSAVRNRDQLGRFASGSGAGSGGLFFQITTGRITDTANVYVPNLMTRGMLWLSDRIRPAGLVTRSEAMTADAKFQPANSIVDKDIVINTQSMISNAALQTNITGTIERVIFSVTYSTLPLTATAMMPVLGKQVFADKATCTANMPMPGVFAYSIEEVVLKIENYQPVLYILGDKIR